MAKHPATLARVPAAIVVCAIHFASSAAVSPHCSLELRVSQEDGSIAPARLHVFVSSSPKSLHQETDGAGSALLFEGVDCGTVRVSVFGTGRRLRPVDLVLVPEIPHTVDFEVPNSRPVSVSVVDPEGQPVPTGQVQFQEILAAEDPAHRRSVGFSPLPHSYPQTVSHHPQRIRFDPARKVRSARINGQAVELPYVIPAGDAAVDVAIVVGPHTVLSGQVLDRDGEGISRATLQSGERLGPVLSGTDGRFKIAMEKLPARVKISMKSWAFEPSSRIVSGSEKELIFIGHELAAQDEPSVVTPKEHVSTDRLRGRVLDRHAEAPLPAKDVRIYPECGSPETNATLVARSASDGTFQIDCRSDCGYRLVVRDHGGTYAPWYVDRPDGDCKSQIVAELERGGILTVHVTDAHGRPMAYQSLRGMGMPGLGTDRSGRCRSRGLGPGAYPIAFTHAVRPTDPRGLALTYREEERGFPVARIEKPGGEVEMDLVALPGGLICVRAVLADGTGASLSTLTVFRAQDRLQLTRSFVRPEERDDPTRICSPPLPTGRYLVRIGGMGLLDRWWSGSPSGDRPQPVDVASGTVVELGPVKLQRKHR